MQGLHLTSVTFTLIKHFSHCPIILCCCNRVEAVCPRVAELNPYVHVEMSSSALDDNADLSFLRKYQVSHGLSESRLKEMQSYFAVLQCSRVFYILSP